MNEIKIFENEQFGQIRIVNTEDEPMFAAVDVCKALGYANGKDAVMSHVDESDRRVFQRSEIATFENVPNRGLTFINESGLYALIFGSKLESAREFKRWVTSEVLPTIRKHGAYMTNDVIERTLTDPDYLIKLATELKNEKQKRLLAENDAKLKQRQLTEQQPKVDFYDAVTKSDDTIDIEEAAKILNFKNIGRNNLFKILRDEKILFGNKPRPYQKYIDDGYFKLVESKYKRGDKTKIGIKTVVYQRGLRFIRDIVIKHIAESQPKTKQLTLFDFVI